MGGFICSRCCGENRGIKIDCPIECRYFKKHERYQRAKLSDDYKGNLLEVIEDLFEEKERDTIGFLAYLENSIYNFYEGEEKKIGQDKEVLEALEFLKRRLSTIEIVETIGSKLGKYLWKGIQEHLPEVPVSDEEAKEAIERLEEVFSRYSDNENPRQCLQGLLGHVEKDFPPLEEEEEEGIISPYRMILTPDDLRRQYR